MPRSDLVVTLDGTSPDYVVTTGSLRFEPVVPVPGCCGPHWPADYGRTDPLRFTFVYGWLLFTLAVYYVLTVVLCYVVDLFDWIHG